MKVSIVIPAYNEENRLPATLKKITDYLKTKNLENEIIVVDDGSEDRTIQVAIREGVKILKNPKNIGKGYSVKRGVLSATGDYIFFMDADLSTPIEEIDKFLLYLEKYDYDIVIGSRASKDAEIIKHQAKLRERMGKIFNFFVRILFNLPYKDTQCGFKGFRKEVAKTLFPNIKIKGFAFDVEVLLKAREKNYRIKELGVRWINSPNSRVKISSSPLLMLGEIFLLKIKK